MAPAMDREQVTKIKNKAEKLAQDGKWRKALEQFEELIRLDPRNDRHLRRSGDMQLKLGDKNEAKRSYKRLADLYAKSGFWAKAISTNKLILEIDPADNEIQKSIVALYSNMGIKKPGGKATPDAIELDTATKSTANPSSQADMERYYPCVSLEEVPAPTVVPALASSHEIDIEVPAEAALAQGDAGIDLIVELSEEAVELKEHAAPAEQLRIPLFSDFGPNELVAIIQKLSTRKLPAASVICQAGQKGDSIFIIAGGSAEVSVNSEDGGKTVVAHLRSGDFFGEFGLLSDGLRHATVIAKTPIELLEITKSDFRSIAEKHPTVLQVLDGYYRKRLVDTILRQNVLFKDLMKEEREKFLARFEFRKVAANSYLFREGDEGGDLYFVKSGAFEVSIKRFNDVVVIAHLGAGDFFGEIALVTGQRRTATIRAENAGEILFLAAADANAIVQGNPLIKEKLEKYVVNRAEDAIAAYKSHQELKKEFALV